MYHLMAEILVSANFRSVHSHIKILYEEQRETPRKLRELKKFLSVWARNSRTIKFLFQYAQHNNPNNEACQLYIQYLKIGIFVTAFTLVLSK